MSRLLIKGAQIVSMDPVIGEMATGDILIEAGKIVAVEPDIAATDAELFDAGSHLVIPGLINAHMHTWQTALRGVTSNWTLLEYFKWVHRGLATAYTPDDIYIGTLAGAVGQMNAGATTLGDWCHNNPTPDHTDAGVTALFESGIRSVFFHGSPKPDPKPGQPHFSEISHPRSEIERLSARRFASRDQLVTLGMAILGPHYSTLDVAEQDIRLAEEFDLIASMHQGGGDAVAPNGWDVLAEKNLLSPRLNIVHGNNLSQDRLKQFIDAGMTFTVTPEIEMTQGHGIPITGKLLAFGSAPSLGVDSESLLSTDLFTVARMALGCQRMLNNVETREQTGNIPETATISTRQALEWITIEGARTLGLSDKIGSITPGKFADLTILRADDLNMWPVHDPISTIITQASLANVEAVLIAGRFVKKDGKVLFDGLGDVKRRLKTSGERILKEIGWAAH